MTSLNVSKAASNLLTAPRKNAYSLHLYFQEERRRKKGDMKKGYEEEENERIDRNRREGEREREFRSHVDGPACVCCTLL